MLRRTLTPLACACAFVLSACSDSTIPTSPDTADLPDVGLQAAKLAGPGSLTGEVGGARYYIEVPENWNGDLVLYAGGYVTPRLSIEGANPEAVEWAKRQELLARGYAWAVSTWSSTGFAVQEGVRSTHQLRGLFASRVGQPDRTYLSSTSMGGLIILRLLEEHPGMYAGALPVCGPLDGAGGFWSGSFHTRALFDYFYPGVLPGNALNPPPGTDGGDLFNDAFGAVLSDPGPAQELIGALPVAMPYADLFELAIIIGAQVSFGDEVIIEEIKERTRSEQLFDNSETVYSGTSDDAGLNEGIDRFMSSPQAENFFRRWYTPSGDLSAPVLSLRTTRDPIVSPYLDDAFAARVDALGKSHLLVRRTFDRFGHCAISAANEYGPAFDDLVSWAETGVVPAP
ncbi:MAG: hypothetical protein M8865_08265 [marine benthic group bacterium]|nr:hypothetical protein [Gemmatimonadota bacterium]